MNIKIIKGIETPVAKFFSSSSTPETDAKASPHIGFYSCATVPANFARALERERDEAREAHSETLEDLEHWKTEYEIVVARLRGERHPRDNGIIALDEIIPKLTSERDEAQVAIRVLAEHGEAEIQRITKERDEAREAWYEMQSSFERSRDEVEKLIRERDEAREIAKEADVGHDMAIADLAKCESAAEKMVVRANELIARWDQPSWKDTAPTARFINALRIAVRAYERET